MHYESNLAGYEEGLEVGAEKERARLRPLLERCLEVVSQDYRHPTLEADLRRESGTPEGK